MSVTYGPTMNISTYSNSLVVSGNTQWHTVGTYTASTTAWNGGLVERTVFATVEDRIEYQQQAYVEPRDHEFRRSGGFTLDSEACMYCHRQNLHRYDPGKHLFLIQEEIPWSEQLRS